MWRFDVRFARLAMQLYAAWVKPKNGQAITLADFLPPELKPKRPPETPTQRGARLKQQMQQFAAGRRKTPRTKPTSPP